MTRTRILMALAAMLFIWPTMMGAEGGCFGGSGGIELAPPEQTTIGDSAAPPPTVAMPADAGLGDATAVADVPKLLCGGDADSESESAFKCFSCTNYLPPAMAVEATVIGNLNTLELALGGMLPVAGIDPLELGFIEDKALRAKVTAICGACDLRAPQAAERMFDKALDLIGPREAHATTIGTRDADQETFNFGERCSDFVVLYETKAPLMETTQKLGIKVLSVDEDGIHDLGGMFAKQQGAYIVVGSGKGTMFKQALDNIAAEVAPATCPFKDYQQKLDPKGLFIASTTAAVKLGYRNEVSDWLFKEQFKIETLLASLAKQASVYAGALDAGEMIRLAIDIADKEKDLFRLVAEKSYVLSSTEMKEVIGVPAGEGADRILLEPPQATAN